MTIELYLIRHGIAADREDYPNDADRPLTSKGRKRTTQVAKQLRDRGLHFDHILTSPLVRARETAVILQDVGLGKQLDEFPNLAPDGNINTWIYWLQEWRQHRNSAGCLALVGHQPDLGYWAELLVWGQSQEKLVVKKAGVIGLTLPETGTPVGQSELFLLMSPKWLI